MASACRTQLSHCSILVKTLRRFMNTNVAAKDAFGPTKSAPLPHPALTTAGRCQAVFHLPEETFVAGARSGALGLSFYSPPVCDTNARMETSSTSRPRPDLLRAIGRWT